MPKLRILKERTAENTDTPNLRGFGDPELFQKSGIDTHLLITGMSDPEADHSWTEFCDAYSLRVDTQQGFSRTRFGGTVLEVGRSIPGEHGSEAVRLFIAAMEILRTHPETRCLLFQTSGLRKVMGEKTCGQQDAHMREAERALEGAFESDSKISLSDSVALTLQQAGLVETRSSTGWTHLQEQELEKIHKRLSGTHANQTTTHEQSQKKQVG